MGIAERKEREKEQRRNDIVDAAEKVFYAKGFQDATMDEVAAEAELSKGTLYLYFKSREDILFSMLIRGTDILNRMLLEVIDEKCSGIENLMTMADTFIRFSKEYTNHFNLFMLFQSRDLFSMNIDTEEVVEYLRDSSPLSILDKMVNNGIADGSLRNDITPGLLTATLWSQMLGVLMVAYTKSDIYKAFGINPEVIAQTHLELVLNGVKKQV